MAKTVVVTGGAGFIGSRLTTLLCDEGFVVRVVDDLSFGASALLDRRAQFVQAAIGDRATLAPVLQGADAVIHLAAKSIIAFSFAEPQAYVETNVVQATALLEEMRRQHVPLMIFSSSAAVYGEPARVPIPERAPKAPITIYGATKSAFEEILSGYHHAFGLHSVSFRYFNAYGPHDLQQPVTRAVPAWTRAALAGAPLRVYWGGRQLRDYVYVDDIARAHVLALGVTGCRRYNLGSGTGVQMRHVLDEIRSCVGRPVEVVDAGERPGDPMRLVADTAAVRRELGWAPQVDLREGIARTVAFYRSIAAAAGAGPAPETGH